MSISYLVNEKITKEDFIDILKRSGLASQRPIDKPEIMSKMIENASLIVTARDAAGQIVGIARCVTDYVYCCYLSCLAVDKAYQHQGVGKELIRQVMLAIGETTLLLLLSIPEAMSYYPKIGFQHEDRAFSVLRYDAHRAVLDKLSD